MDPQYTTPKAIAEAGEMIYRNRYQTQYEPLYRGKFLAINVKSQSATLGDSPEDVLNKAKIAEPEGLFHLIRIGYSGAFQMSFAHKVNANQDWIFG